MKKLLLSLATVAAGAVAMLSFAGASPDGNPSVMGDYIRSNGAHMKIRAVQHKDGRVDGQMVYETDTATIIAELDGIMIIGNKAILHGIVVVSTANPNLLGRHSYHMVIDNGEGAVSAPDRAGAFVNVVNPLPDPLSFFGGDGAEILDGFIQVHAW